MKERIIGAIVLVIIVVLIVPVFLDGPPDGGEIITERVLLPGQEDQDIKTVVLNRGRTEPIPMANGPKSTTTDTLRPDVQPEAQQLRTDPSARVAQEIESPPVTTLAAPATSTTGMWAVQLGSFSNKENAEKLAADLRKQGYAAFLSQLQTSSGRLHRVRIGPQKDRVGAEAMAARLKKVNHEGQVVPHP